MDPGERTGTTGLRQQEQIQELQQRVLLLLLLLLLQIWVLAAGVSGPQLESPPLHSLDYINPLAALGTVGSTCVCVTEAGEDT